MTRFALLIVCALLASACRTNVPQIVLAQLQRSGKIQLLCADLEQPTAGLIDFRQVLPLSACTGDFTVSDEVALNFLGAVTQTQTGEVSAVNFSNNLVFDTNRAVPGFTAFRVGEQPTGLQISPIDPTYTYISSFSPKSVQAVPTEAIISSTVSLPFPNDIRFDAAPTDLGLYEFGAPNFTFEDGQLVGADPQILFRYLYVPLPDLGQVAQIKVEIDETTGQQTLGDPTFLNLGTEDCGSITQVTPDPSTAADYNRICPMSRDVKAVDTTLTCIDGALTGPRPIAVTVDYGAFQGIDNLDDDVLLVADLNQPVIHRFRLDANGATLIEPIATGTPTIDVATTPFVPATSDREDRDATERYLYAISATDSSILAVNYTPDSDTFGAVLPVVAGVSVRANEENVESRNRVRSLFSNARSIEVVTPDYTLVDGEVPETSLCNPAISDARISAQNESNMRGVFLAVSLANGSLFFLDIYDLNAPCRGGEPPTICTVAETGPDALASIRRHRRRWGITPTSFISIDGSPSLQFNAAPGTLDEFTGEAGNSDGPGLEFIDCPPSMFSVFGLDLSGQADGLICTSSQVWSNFSQRWDAVWEGLIPGTEGGLGLFSTESFDGQPGNWFLAGDRPFCELGVLGEQFGPGGDLSIEAETAYGGDRVLITGELPPNRRDEPACEKFEDVPDEIEDSPVWFPILRAFNDQLEIGSSPNPNRYTLEEVAFCFNQFTEYQIHTQSAYAVVGSESGFIHRTIADPLNNECIFDESRPVNLDDVDTYLTARAFPDALFINPLVSFQIEPFDPRVAVTDSTIAILNFSILNGFGVLFLDTSGAQDSLPSNLLYSIDAEQLFFVDLEIGVRRVVFSPLSILQSFE